MKWITLLGLMIFAPVTFAIPFTCSSLEKIQGTPVVKFKINPQRPVKDNGSVWDFYLIGVTPAEGFRKIVYASGNVDNDKISLSFVLDGTLLGTAEASSNSDGTFEGDANIRGFAGNKNLQVKCEPSPGPSDKSIGRTLEFKSVKTTVTVEKVK